MQTYILIYYIEPLKESPEYGKIKGADAEIWVKAPSPEQAPQIAKAYLSNLAYKIIETLHELAPLPEQLPQYDKYKLKEQSEKNGIAAFLNAYPLKDQKDTNVVQLRRSAPHLRGK